MFKFEFSLLASFEYTFYGSLFGFLRAIANLSPSSVGAASKRCVRLLDNKQKSQAEILENYQALPFCFRVS